MSCNGYMTVFSVSPRCSANGIALRRSGDRESSTAFRYAQKRERPFLREQPLQAGGHNHEKAFIFGTWGGTLVRPVSALERLQRSAAKNSDVSEQAAQLASGEPAKSSDVSEQAAQLAAVYLGKGTMLTDAVEYSLGVLKEKPAMSFC